MFVIPIQITNAQENWVSYCHAIPIIDYEGHQFRFQASIKTEIDDDSASVRLGVRVDTENGVGFNKMRQTPIRNTAWDTYTIEGKIDTGAYQLVFGSICQYNGKFYHDDIRIDIKTKDNQWKNVFVENFEKGFVSLLDR